MGKKNRGRGYLPSDLDGGALHPQNEVTSCLNGPSCGSCTDNLKERHFPRRSFRLFCTHALKTIPFSAGKLVNPRLTES